MIEPQHPRLSVARQCELVSISRSGFYYQPAGETPLNLALMRLIDVQFLETPWYGSRQMARHLRREGYTVGRKRMRRLMARMGLEPIYQRPRTTIPHPGHRIYPYLLRDMVIDRPNQVWCADITYIPMRRGFHYLVAIMDWSTRKVLSWRLSNTMDGEFCIEALEDALARFGCPEIFNTDKAASLPHHASPLCCRKQARASQWTVVDAGWMSRITLFDVAESTVFDGLPTSASRLL
jgi:putative transposase